MTLKDSVQTAILVVGLFSLIVFGASYYFVLCDATPSQQPLKDALSITASFFGGFATLTAAYIASRLFNDWKEEKNFDIENNYLSNIIKNIKPIYSELLEIRSNANNLKRIDKSLMLKTNYIERARLDFFSSTINLYPDIQIYSELTKNYQLIELYKKFESRCIAMDNYYKILFLERYKNYYQNYLYAIQDEGKTTLDNYDIFRSYENKDQKNKVIIDIEEIIRFFSDGELSFLSNNKKQITSFDTMMKETIEIHDEILHFCINKLRP